MKRLAVIMVAAMLVLSLAGQAAAYFEDFNLIRSIYTTTGAVEVGSDLGADVRTFSVAAYPVQPVLGIAPVPATNPVHEYRGNLINLNTFDGPLSSLVVGYWAHGESDKDLWAAGFLTTPYGGTDNDGLTMLGRKQSTADATYNAVQGLYDDSLAAVAIINPKTNLNSYFVAFDKSTAGSGQMGANLKNDSYEMTLSLAALETVGYVDQLLYWFDYNGTSSDKPGVEKAVIRTFLTSDGINIDLSGDKIATVINPSAVPIPGSVLLFASGLLGLFGLRRKKT